MIVSAPQSSRTLQTQHLESDLVVVGGGLAGVCCAVTAARQGIRVTLVQDRPVLGGNASSEVRLWALGATSHMGNNNRWAREGGLADELLVENTWRNPEGNPLLFDALLLETATREPNLTLLLNTAVYEAVKNDDGAVASVTAFCSQNATQYQLSAPLFCDASGDGIVGFLTGAAFRMGAETESEFGEKFAPTKEYGELLGHSLYFYSKDVGRPVRYVPPAFALTDVEGRIPRFRAFNTQTYGCRLWWIEYGGRLDTIHDTEQIKWELWKVVYGVWDYIKNSGKFPDAANLTLEWVGHIPGKRESRRFEGDYLLRQQDIVEQTAHPDAVAYGGWSIDLHPADGVFSEKPGCNQWHSKGIFGIPYRCLYSRSVPNLFLAGRLISASHVAFGSTRVMVTAAHAAQAVGIASAICVQQDLRPRDLAQGTPLARLQRDLLRTGQHIPGFSLRDDEDLATRAHIEATSALALQELPADGPDLPLTSAWAMLLPVPAGPPPVVTFTVDAAEATELTVELRASSRAENFTPDVTLATRRYALPPGPGQTIEAAFPEVVLETGRYLFYCLSMNPTVTVKTSAQRLTGVLSLCNRFNPAVARSSSQTPPGEIGVDCFEFWCPQRRPAGRNLAITIAPPLAEAFAPRNVVSGLQRPTGTGANAWLADSKDPAPALTLTWDEKQTIERVELFFDTDYDHPMETVLMGHPEAEMPFCVSRFRLRDAAGTLLAAVDDNHQTHRSIRFDTPITTDTLRVELEHPAGEGRAPAALFEVRCYGSRIAGDSVV
ncbi:MAG: FAD-dependent oxidoreductase [Cytophagales bacterium]|nr:FAD-dependent oxidoreductase [Armatimonadota bacterium]